MKHFGILLGALIGSNFDEFIVDSIFHNLKCSINEITEKTNLKEHEILLLLDKGVFKGRKIYGVKYVLGYSAYGVENKVKNMINKARNK